MKQIFTLLIIIICITFIKAQTPIETDSNNIEVGINATAFITNIFKTGLTNDYKLMIKKKIKNGKTLRFAGGLYGNFLAEDPSGPDLTNGTIISNTYIDLRGGIEKEYFRRKNWAIKTGLDIISGYSLYKTKINFGERTSNDYYLGIGPIAGIEYTITPRMSLLTEASFYFSVYENNIKDEFNDPLNNESYKRTYFRFIMSLPTNLFFVFKF